MAAVFVDDDPFTQAGYTPAELRRALHNASTTLSIAEVPGRSDIRERALLLARGKLAGVLGKLDHLIAMVDARRLLSPSPTDTPITPITTSTVSDR